MADFALFVIGGGSGGLSAAKRAAMYGRKVALAEMNALGGTCVNVGCIPKKYMWFCGSIAQTIREAKSYGYAINPEQVKFSWEAMKEARDKSIKRLNTIHRETLEKNNISFFPSKASFIEKKDGIFYLKVGNRRVTAEHVIVASGSRADLPAFEGGEHCINSDGFFYMKSQPQKVAVIGAGYIAVELASILTLLKTETHLFTRGDFALRKFDSMVREACKYELSKEGCNLHPESTPQKVEKDTETGLLTLITDKESVSGFDTILVAIGRSANTDELGFENIDDVKCSDKGLVEVDAYQNTSVPNLYAIGDACGEIQLTPVAIYAGRTLIDRIFQDNKTAKLDTTFVPTVIFTHPCIATVGETEENARKKYEADDLNIYTSSSVCLYHNLIGEPEERPKIHFKLICLKNENDRIIGLHMIGMNVDEILQGFAVALNMGATKHDFDRCIAIHPTVAEELVTLQPWRPFD